MEVPPAKRANDRECDNEEKEFSQTAQADGRAEAPTPARSERESDAGACVPMAGTVLPTTGAICRTCVINSSNCSG